MASILPNKLKIINYYDTEPISNFLNKNVVYIGYIGEVNDMSLFKYGNFYNMQLDDEESLRDKYKSFVMVYMVETDNYDLIIKLFEIDLKNYGLYKKVLVGEKKKPVNFFTITETKDVEFFVYHMENLVENNITSTAKKLNDVNKDLNYLNHIIELKDKQIMDLQKQINLYLSNHPNSIPIPEEHSTIKSILTRKKSSVRMAS